ncbi:hypothetical protein BDQ17DRAFT_1342240 [Cyathus striatus]|nr:hypothetical protein BDQ17DRAFT_1342240 [Cyathus striatus]
MTIMPVTSSLQLAPVFGSFFNVSQLFYYSFIDMQPLLENGQWMPIRFMVMVQYLSFRSNIILAWFFVLFFVW